MRHSCSFGWPWLEAFCWLLRLRQANLSGWVGSQQRLCPRIQAPPWLQKARKECFSRRMLCWSVHHLCWCWEHDFYDKLDQQQFYWRSLVVPKKSLCLLSWSLIPPTPHPIRALHPHRPKELTKWWALHGNHSFTRSMAVSIFSFFKIWICLLNVWTLKIEDICVCLFFRGCGSGQFS